VASALLALIAPGLLITLKQTSPHVLRARLRKEKVKAKETAVPLTLAARTLEVDKPLEAHPLEATPRNEAARNLEAVMVAETLVVAHLVRRNAEASHLAKDLERDLTSRILVCGS